MAAIGGNGGMSSLNKHEIVETQDLIAEEIVEEDNRGSSIERKDS